MLLGRVTGTVVASRKEPLMEGCKFLLVRQLDVENREVGGLRRRRRRGRRRRGRGGAVRHRAARPARPETTQDRPCDAVVMAIVDTWEVGGDEGLPQVAGARAMTELDEREIQEIIARVRRRVAAAGDGPAGRRRCGPRRSCGRRRGRARRRHPPHHRRGGGRGDAAPSPPTGRRASRARKVIIEAIRARRCSTTPSGWPAWPTRRPTSAASRTRSSRTGSSPTKAPGPGGPRGPGGHRRRRA